MSLFSRLAASPIWIQLRQWRLFKFGMVGASGTLVNLGVLYACQELVFRFIASPEIRLNFSLGAAILVATINNFAWNRRWTWRDRPRKAGQSVLAQFGRYAIACWTGIVLQFLFTKMLAGHMAYLFANLLAIAGASAFNFAVNNLWTFRHRRSAEHSSGGS